MDDSAPRTSYSKDYTLNMRIAANPDTYNQKKDWKLIMEFRCHDLLQLMREGLIWTTSNVVPERGWLNDATGPNAAYHPYQRVWELREFADKSESQCRWVATATLYAQSVETLANFRLQTLYRQNIGSSLASDKNGNYVFLYNRVEKDGNYNCFVDNLHPSYGSWWFWPMTGVSGHGTPVDIVKCQAKTEMESLI